MANRLGPNAHRPAPDGKSPVNEGDGIRNLADHKKLVARLSDPARFPHRVDAVQQLETHISTVLLAGEFAYKIKKPLNLGFLDFSRLASRGHFCDEELRLNRRLAPQIYLRRAAITGTAEEPAWDGEGPAIEYAVCMHRFNGGHMLDVLLERGDLTTRHMDDLARSVAEFHGKVPTAATDSAFGTLDAVLHPARENFDGLRSVFESPAVRSRLDALRQWTDARAQELEAEFNGRREAGFIRECHGDMHLANMVLIDDRPVIFDALEFDPALRWIDTMSELAFLVMDLERRGAPGFASRVLNGYLERTGDYEGLRVFDFYRCYRAMVRAKIHALTATQRSGDEARAALGESLAYIELAEAYVAGREVALAMTHGFSGSGKSTVAQSLVDRCGFVRLRSDVERKRLHGLKASESAGAAPAAGLYGSDATRKTYQRLRELAEIVVGCGFPAVLDATYLDAGQRRSVRATARRLGVPFRIVEVVAPRETLRSRIERRALDHGEPSDADVRVLNHQFAHADPLTETERERTLTVDTVRPGWEQTVRCGALLPSVRE